MFRTAVYTACAAGIISTVVYSAAVGKENGKMIKLIVNTIAVICLIKPFLSVDLDFTVSELTELENESEYLSLERDFSHYYILNAEMTVKQELEKRFKESGLDCDSIVITCEMNEYHIITVKKVEVHAPEQYKDKLRDIVLQLVPDTEVTVNTEASHDNSSP